MESSRRFDRRFAQEGFQFGIGLIDRVQFWIAGVSYRNSAPAASVDTIDPTEHLVQTAKAAYKINLGS
jgi:hypothetical protein